MKRAIVKIINSCADKAKVKIKSIETRSRHIKVLVEGNKVGTVFVSTSASDYRAFLNVIADMKKVGYKNDQAYGK